MAELEVRKRDILGKKVAALRARGLIPAELYGHGVENMHVSIPADAFQVVYKEAGEHAIVTVLVDGASLPVLIHGVERHPITREVLAVDLYQVRMDEKVTTHVPLAFEGSSSAVDDLGGVLVKAASEIEVEALPADIPERIVVDLTQFTEFDQSIYVKDLPTSEKYEFTAESDAVIASVSAPREEEEEEPAEELTPEDVVVEGEEKRAEREGADEGQPADDDEKSQEKNTSET